MGIFDCLRRARADRSPHSQAFEALAAEMTKQGALIITRDDGLYTVYWARELKRSVEGKGATVLEGMLDCRAQAIRMAHKPAAD